MPYKKLFLAGAFFIGALFIVLWPQLADDGGQTKNTIEKVEIVLLGVSSIAWILAAFRFAASRSARGLLDAMVPVTLSIAAASALAPELRGTGLQGNIQTIVVFGLVVLVLLWACLTSVWWRTGPKRWDTVAEALSAPTSQYILLGCGVFLASQVSEHVLGVGALSHWLQELLEIEGLYTFLFAAIVTHVTLKARLQ